MPPQFFSPNHDERAVFHKAVLDLLLDAEGCRIVGSVVVVLRGRRLGGSTRPRSKPSVRAGVLGRAEEVKKALEEEIANSERQLDDLRRKRDAALGRLVSASPEFLHIYRRMRAQWTKLRTLRATVLAVSSAANHPLGGRLLDLAQVEEPLWRAAGYKVDDKFVNSWVEAVSALRDRDPDTVKLPNHSGRD